MGNGVTMFDIMADDLDRARRFYQNAFGWKTKQVPGTPAIARALPGQPTGKCAFVEAIPGPIDERGFLVDTGAITGLLSERMSGFNSPLLILEVRDINEALANTEHSGGRILHPAQQAGDLGSYAYVEDTEGNILSLWQDVVPGLRLGVSRTFEGDNYYY